jgi:uncharacterized membrane protein SirB2
MDYFTLKTLHQGAVALSLAGFVVRGAASLRGAAWVGGRIAKTLPHVVDTVLLVSALLLAWQLRLTPGNAPWLTAKIVGLLVYIGLGALALRPGRPRAMRTGAWFAALAVFGWIVSVALTRNPLGIGALL